MRLRNLLFVFILNIAASYAGTNPIRFEHDIPTGVIRGDKVQLEVLSMDMGPSIHDMHVFFRELGEQNYRQMAMKGEGYLYSAIINTANTTTGQIEYYIAYEGRLGQIGTLPEANPQLNPYILRIAPAKTAQDYADFEIVILSPLPEDVLPNDEIVIAASVLGGESDIDFTLSKLYIDEVDVSPVADFSDGIITYVPNRLRLGRRIIKLQLFNNSGELIQEREWAFRVIEAEAGIKGLDVRGSVFLDNRNQEVSNVNDNFFRGGGYLTGNFDKLDFYSRILFSSEETEESQPVNRYTAELQYNFTDRSHIYVHGGDYIPYYNQLIFRDKRIRGVQAGLALGFFTLDYILGQSYRGVEGSFDIDANNDTLQSNGTYSENVMAIRPGFRFGDNVQWNLNLVNAKEDENSIQYGGNVNEGLVLGTDLSMNFDNRRILFEASVQASIKNTDAGGPEIDFEDLVEIDSSLADYSGAEKAFDLLKSTGFLSATGGLNILPSLAMQFDLQLRYLNNNLRLTYLNIPSEFVSPGNPYLLKDISGFYITDSIRLFRNQMFLNLFFKNYANNLVDGDYSTKNIEFGSTLSYFPFRNLPSLSLSYARHNRDNGVSVQDTVLHNYLYLEDNVTQRISIASSYNINIKKIKNTLSVNLSTYQRDDDANRESQSEYNSLTVSLRTKFNFPLTTTLSYVLSGTAWGDTSKTTTDIDRYSVRLDYLISDLFGRDFLRPFVNLSFQNIDSDFESTGYTSTSRNNYSLGLAYQTASYGIFTLRYDQINYTVTEENITDRIINARYEIHF